MDRQLIIELHQNGSESMDSIDYIQSCIDIYENTLRDMGISQPNVENSTLETTQLQYENNPYEVSEYACISTDY
jgi:hypothetical protein